MAMVTRNVTTPSYPFETSTRVMSGAAFATSAPSPPAARWSPAGSEKHVREACSGQDETGERGRRGDERALAHARDSLAQTGSPLARC